MLVALICLAVEAALLRSTKTVAPFDMNGATFVSQVESEKVDHLILLYSPTCPDCQWFMSRWAALAEDLRSTEIAVWTVADPGFLAPDPYVHWHNPAIFLAPANTSKPIPFSNDLLEAYLKGDARPQDAQDRAFRQGLLDFVAQSATNTLQFRQADDVVEQSELNHLAESAWRLLQKRWGIAKDGETAEDRTHTTGLVQQGARVEARVMEYTNAYAAAHAPLSPADRAFIERYYRQYFQSHPR
jgi:hypothetical protein